MNSYDDVEVFNNFVEFRKESSNKHSIIREILIDMIGNCDKKNVLDLGCGIGEFTKYFDNKKASYILGIDISKREIEYAKQNNNGRAIEYRVLDIKEINALNKKFDIVFSDMVFNYIEDFETMIKNINELLNTDGELIFSMVHPISTASTNMESEWINDENNHLKFLLDNYSNVSKRQRKYFGGVFNFYHRRFEDIITILVRNNFEILELKEPYSTEKEYNRPSFLIMKAKKINRDVVGTAK